MCRFTYFLSLELQKHSLITGLGASYRRQGWNETDKDTASFALSPNSYPFLIERWGYCASLAYQFRVYRNFGLSADVVFRHSKDIPNTISYGAGLTCSIFNKRKGKDEGK